MIYDKVKHDELIARLGKKEAELAELSNKIHDNDATDEWTDQKVAEHSVCANKYLVVDAEIKSLKSEVEKHDLMAVQANKPKGELSWFDRWMEKGIDGITSEEKREHLLKESKYMGLGADITAVRMTIPKITAATRTDDASGQETKQEYINPDVVEALAFQGDGIMDLSYRFMTNNGSEYRFIQFDEATEVGTIIEAQNTAIADNDLANFGITTFHARTVTSGFIPITREALQDSVVDLGGFANRRAGRRIMRAIEKEITLDGDGTGTRATSVINGSQDGVSNATADTLVYSDIVNLIYSCPRAYRNGGEMGEYSSTARPGTVGFCFGDSFEKVIVTMLDDNNRPIWMPANTSSLGSRPQNMILGYPYRVSMDGVWKDLDSSSATGDVLAAFGNWGYWGRRTVNNVELFRFQDSGTMVNNAIKILALARFDFQPIGALDNAGKTSATRLLKNT